MWFGVLGPVLASDGDSVVGVPAGRLRVLLAALIVRAGTVVPADALAEAVWDGSPPAGSEATLRSHVMRLRRVLGPAAGARVVTRYPGYLLQAGDHEVDVLRFGCLTRDSRAAVRAGQWARAWDLLDEGLGLWRGEPLADVPSDLLRREQVAGLEESRLQAAEWRADAGLQLGRQTELVAELRSLTAAHPLRERFHAQLMVALYRCGRQGEALAAYQHARAVLVEELAAEPGPELQQLHQQILAADPALATAEPPRPVESRPRLAVPRELPPAVPGFTGRSAELQALTRLLDRSGGQAAQTVVISAIGGTAGVGKTALAVHWAHQVAGRFPDGQLYVNLRGYDPGPPVLAADALAGFIRTLGVPGQDIPPETHERAARYRSLLVRKRMLVVLDNASTAEQVRPLLPGTPGCAVLVTSRDALAGLVARDGAARLDLDLLPLEEAVALLTELIGDQTEADPDAAAELARRCVRLPLALRVAAELAAARPQVPLTDLVADLTDQQRRLDLLDAAGDLRTAVRAVFSWSYQQLSGEAARMFRLLGIHPGPDISVPAAAGLAGVPEADTHRLLQGLARAHLIAEHILGRYAFHDLLRAYAAEQAHHTDSHAERAAATGRVLDHYLHTAASAGRLLIPAKEPVVLAAPRPGSVPGQPADHRQALAWFEAERQVLLAAVTFAADSGLDTHAWQLPWAMEPFLHARGHYQEWTMTQRTALAAATRLGDTAGRALSGRLLAMAFTELGDHDQARGHYTSSLTLYRRLGNRLGEAKIQHSLTVLAERQGRYADALRHAEQALRLYQAIGDKANEADALNAVGWTHGLLGDYQQAHAFCHQALTLSAEIGHRRLEGYCWDSLGYAEHHLGNLAEAAACYQRALSLHRESSERFTEADTLTHLGDTYHAADELAQAREAWQHALAIFEDLQHPNAGQIRAKLASTSHHSRSGN